jgi:FkbM family methyltransferase
LQLIYQRKTRLLSLSRLLCNSILNHPFKGSDRIRNLISRILIPSAEGPTVISFKEKFNIIVDPTKDKGLESSLYYHGTYEEGTLFIIAQCLGVGDIFIDVGANIGLMSLFASTKVGDTGKIYAFEPEPDIFQILMQNIDLNNFQNIELHMKALGSKTESGRISLAFEDIRGSATLSKSDSDSHGKDIEMIPLDVFINKNRIRIVKMIKVDVEGWELEVLKGGTNLLCSDNAPILCVEYNKLTHHDEYKMQSIYEFIKSQNDYQIYKLIKSKERVSQLIEITDKSKLPDHDNIFCFLPKHRHYLPHFLFSSE